MDSSDVLRFRTFDVDLIYDVILSGCKFVKHDDPELNAEQETFIKQLADIVSAIDDTRLEDKHQRCAYISKMVPLLDKSLASPDHAAILNEFTVDELSKLTLLKSHSLRSAIKKMIIEKECCKEHDEKIYTVVVIAGVALQCILNWTTVDGFMEALNLKKDHRFFFEIASASLFLSRKFREDAAQTFRSFSAYNREKKETKNQDILLEIDGLRIVISKK
jgi:hypothetical protein